MAHRLLGDAAGVLHQTRLAHRLVASAHGVRPVRARLGLAGGHIAGGRRVLGRHLHDSLMQDTALRRGEEALLDALLQERGDGKQTGHLARLVTDLLEKGDLVPDADLERIDFERRAVGVLRGGDPGEPHRFATQLRVRPRDAHGLRRHAGDRVLVDVRGRGETPGPAVQNADAETEAFLVGDGRNIVDGARRPVGSGTQQDALCAVAVDANIGVRRAQGSRRIEGDRSERFESIRFGNGALGTPCHEAPRDHFDCGEGQRRGPARTEEIPAAPQPAPGARRQRIDASPAAGPSATPGVRPHGHQRRERRPRLRPCIGGRPLRPRFRPVAPRLRAPARRPRSVAIFRSLRSSFLSWLSTLRRRGPTVDFSVLAMTASSAPAISGVRAMFLPHVSVPPAARNKAREAYHRFLRASTRMWRQSSRITSRIIIRSVAAVPWNHASMRRAVTCGMRSGRSPTPRRDRSRRGPIHTAKCSGDQARPISEGGAM